MPYVLEGNGAKTDLSSDGHAD